jgi:hypothetical protein
MFFFRIWISFPGYWHFHLLFFVDDGWLSEGTGRCFSKDKLEGISRLLVLFFQRILLEVFSGYWCCLYKDLGRFSQNWFFTRPSQDVELTLEIDWEKPG